MVLEESKINWEQRKIDLARFKMALDKPKMIL